MLNPFLKSIIQEIGNNRYLPTFLSNITILVVAVQVDRDRYVQYLQSNTVNGVRSYCFLEAETIEEGLELWRSQSPDIVLLDVNLTSGDGIKFLAAIADDAEDLKLPVIALTEQSKEGMAARAMKLGALDYLIKEDLTEVSLSDCVHQISDRIARTRQLQAKIHHLYSEQKRASILLSESEQRYKSLASSAPVGIFRTDRSGQCTYVNERYCQITGLTPESALGEGWQQGIHLDDREMLIAAWQKSIQNNHCPFQLEYRFQHNDGKVIWVYGQCVAECDDNGEAISYVGTLTDISDRKQAEIFLKKSEAHQRALISAIPDLIMRINRSGIYLEFVANDNFHVVGDIDELIGTHVFDSLPLNEAQKRLDFIQLALQTNTIKTYEQDLSIEGRFQIEEVRVVPYSEDEVLLLVRDISDRKQAEIALQKSESNSRSILAAIPDLLFRMGSDGIYRGFITEREFDVRLQVCDFTSYAMTDLLPPEIAERHFYHMQQALQTGEMQMYEHQIQISDRLQDEEVRVIKTGDDEVLFIIRDISDRKQAERALKKSEITNRAIIETIPDLLIQMDLQGNYISMLAGSGVRVFRSTESSSSNLPELYQFLSADLAEERLHYAKQAIATGSLQIYEQIFTFDDEQHYEEVRIAPLNEREVLVIIRDIIDAKQAEAERLNNAELRRETRLKDEFLANMSHELRTPLNAILGMSEGLLEQVFGELNERQINALQTIESSGSHLLELINDILDIAKIESGQMELNCKPTSIVSLCQSSLTFIRQQAIAKRIQIKTQLPTNLPDLFVDDLRIRQVLINLLNNAVKFTAEGGQITLGVSLISQSEDLQNTQNYLQISIADTGIGISPENINKLFQPFIQVDSALNRKYEGTGLGLALVKQIVELHGGTVELTSELGVGSCFTFILPYVDHVTPLSTVNPQAESTHEPSPPNHNSKFSILIADDNEANVLTISTYLEAHGYRLLIANNGQESIALTKSENPDLILMDIQMPSMDGIEAIQKIRQIPSLVNVPIIALTALAMADDRDRCLAAGASEYIPKPVKLKALAQTIQQLLESKSGSSR
ncbi:response regulator [Pseudanabaena mucicola]|uniref:histidine kinase n=1 Tax=Pseudanabaena mucicola FACHB-723 TaxID=2692860 RepID=A0ABR7ZZR4_9CYAN|nr:response regulator [Pseudanabaena mucicola]MBD2189397.1 response regulator [Pseudanabaena mucicola FACHB-723]